MTKDDRFQKAEDCLQKAEDNAKDEPMARVYEEMPLASVPRVGEDVFDLLAEWHRRNDGRKMPFAEDEDKRCEAVRVPGRDIFDQPDKTIYRCGRAKGHDGRHACSDEGGVTLKWFTEGADSQ